MDSPAESAAKVLSSKGEKLHTHEMHIRRSDNKGFIAKHDLANKHGAPPRDGQKSSKEHTHPGMKELLADVQQHMQQPTEPGEPEEPEPEPGQTPPGTPQPGQTPPGTPGA
jgi:hypothetical protein